VGAGFYSEGGFFDFGRCRIVTLVEAYYCCDFDRGVPEVLLGASDVVWSDADCLNNWMLDILENGGWQGLYLEIILFCFIA